jgi:hypothetical protein
MKSQLMLKKIYKEAELYFKENPHEFQIPHERKRFILDDENKVKDNIPMTSPSKKLRKELSPKQAEIVRRIVNQKLRRMRKDIL